MMYVRDLSLTSISAIADPGGTNQFFFWKAIGMALTNQQLVVRVGNYMFLCRSISFGFRRDILGLISSSSDISSTSFVNLLASLKFHRCCLSLLEELDY